MPGVDLGVVTRLPSLWRRLRRWLRRRELTFGIALGGGAVRGAAHLGVLSVLDDAGVRPAAVAGTSIGAIVGAGYAAGIPADELFEVFRNLGWLSVVRPSFSLSLANPLDLSGLESQLRDRLGLSTFADLQIPFAAVACDIMSGEEVVLTSGDVVQAVLASAAIPGLFRPLEIGGRLLVDGGVVNNLPVDVVLAMGVDRVVGVDLLSCAPLSEPPHNLLEIWSRSGYLMIRANQPHPEEMDLHIEPDLAGCTFTGFSQADLLYRRGLDAGHRALPELCRALDLDPPPDLAVPRSMGR